MPSATVSDTDRSDIDKTFDDLLNLLRSVAAGAPPSRELAVSYLAYRSQLLSSENRDMLPGFLYQCGTIDRFRDFIMLYDPDSELRQEFLTRMIDKARKAITSGPSATGNAASSATPSPLTWEFLASRSQAMAL